MDALPLESLITLAGLVLIGAAVLGFVLFTAGELRARAVRQARLTQAPVLEAAGPSAPAQPLAAQLGDAMKRLGQQAAIRDPAQLTVLRAKLMRAGFFNREAAVIYLGARAVAMGAATLGVILTLPLVAGGEGGGLLPVMIAALLAGAALLGPDFVLDHRRRDREQEYREGFPDLLDLLVASVEAGLSLDAAVSRVGDELVRRYPRLTIHLRVLTLELRAGKMRKDAWAGFADRLGIEDARAFATMLRQSEEMGTSLGETLSVFSADMRAKRMLRAEEKALALPAKLTIPLILFIFPCLLGVLLLPAIARLTEVFGQMP